jgi:hypothetical protein
MTTRLLSGRWFTDFWGETCNLRVVEEIAAPDMLLKYSLHEPRKGREDIKAFMTDFRAAFPNLNFRGTADLIAEGDYVVGQWEGGGTHAGPAFKDFLAGVAYRSSVQRSPPVRRRGSGACPDTRRSNRPCATTTSTHSVSDSISLSKLNPVEPPWYGPVCPVVWEGWYREVSPYLDQSAP